MESLYNYLLANYKENEPILSASLSISGISPTNMRQQLKKINRFRKNSSALTAAFTICLKKSIFKSGSPLAPEKVLECKYLREKDNRCGYLSGLMFFNQLGLTTQVPMQYEVVTNKATNEYRETSLAKSRVIVRRPKVPDDRMQL